MWLSYIVEMWLILGDDAEPPEPLSNRPDPHCGGVHSEMESHTHRGRFCGERETRDASIVAPDHCQIAKNKGFLAFVSGFAVQSPGEIAG